MRIKSRAGRLAAGAAAIGFVVFASVTPAMANESGTVSDTASSASVTAANPPDTTYGTQYGSTLRAKLSNNYDGSGGSLRVYGSGPCTRETDKPDVSIKVMPGGYNDIISGVADYNSCDVKLYLNGGTTGTNSGYVNYTETTKYVGASWNDNTSSVAIS